MTVTWTPRTSTTRRSLLSSLVLLASFQPGLRRASAAERLKVGALRFSSSGALFVAEARGYFQEEGLSVEMVFFDAAPAIPVAIASGDLDFGLTALTAALYNLAGKANLAILAGQAREERGKPGNLILVSRQAHEQGARSLGDLFGRTFGLTQFGSPSHYQLGQLAQAAGVGLKTVPIRAFQSLPNLAAALKTGQVDWAIIAPPVATNLVEAGDAVAIGRYADHFGYQFGALFAARRTIEARGDMARRFVRAYTRGLRDYAVLNEEGPTSAAQRDTASIVARFVYPGEDPAVAVPKVLASALYVDPSGAVDRDDIARQIAWYRENGMLSGPVDLDLLVDLRFLPVR